MTNCALHISHKICSRCKPAQPRPGTQFERECPYRKQRVRVLGSPWSQD